jgi:hypothetical protein
MPRDVLSEIPSSEEVWDKGGRAFTSQKRGIEPKNASEGVRWILSTKRAEEPKGNKAKPKAKPKAKSTSKVEISKDNKQRPLTTLMDFDIGDVAQYKEDKAYDDALTMDEKGISEEEMLGLFPGVENKGPEDFTSDLAMALAGAGILRGAGKLAGKLLKKTGKVEAPLTKGTLDTDLEVLKSSPDKQQKLFDYVKGQADKAGGKESLVVQGGEVIPTKTGKVQRLFFKEVGQTPAKSGAMQREGMEAIGNKSGFNRALERFNKQLLKGEGASESSLRTQLQNMGFSEKEIAEILKNRGG